MQRLTSLCLILGLLCCPASGWAKARARGGDANLQVEYVGMKAKGGWTAVVVAIQNTGTHDAEFACCEAYLENAAGYAIPALSGDEMAVLIHNRAKTAAAIGALIGAGLGIVGAVSGSVELIYAATGVGVASGIAGVAGQAAAEGEARHFVIDNVWRAKAFPAGLKVAGVIYFPPRKKWPNSKDPQALHLTYKLRDRTYRITAPAPS
ncbi:MAG: hypothetical protein HY543_07275 [Deltaproteobacteria bacterium]|nr:hypothetical protein [Deltaproteobacteria bacterium]